MQFTLTRRREPGAATAELLGALFALVGLAVVVISAVRGSTRLEESADPGTYRDGLDHARVSSLAWEAEQAIYRAAWKQHNE